QTGARPHPAWRLSVSAGRAVIVTAPPGYWRRHHQPSERYRRPQAQFLVAVVLPKLRLVLRTQLIASLFEQLQARAEIQHPVRQGGTAPELQATPQAIGEAHFALQAPIVQECR